MDFVEHALITLRFRLTQAALLLPAAARGTHTGN